MRRSIAKLQPGTKALSREDAMRLIAELQDVEGRLKRLKVCGCSVWSMKTSR
jgi:hypothetical protein